MHSIKIINASHASSIYRYMNTKLKLLNCNANSIYDTDTQQDAFHKEKNISLFPTETISWRREVLYSVGVGHYISQ
jgi:hypothetical protein